MIGFARREFCLVLLRRMADLQPGLSLAARNQLGASSTDSREANKRWNSGLHSQRWPDGVERYRVVLGPSVGRPVSVGDLRAEVHAWPLPLWPDLEWQVLTDVTPTDLDERAAKRRRYHRAGTQDGPAQDWHCGLERPGPRPDLPPPDELAPWQATLGDALAQWPTAVPLPQDVPSRDRVLVDRRVLTFVHGLLQTVDEVTGPDHPAWRWVVQAGE